MKHAIATFATLLLCCSTATAEAPPQQAQVLDWQPLPPLPDAHGFAGAFAGVSCDALIVAGGANFPGGRPWEGAKKVWHDDVFVLDAEKGKETEAKWRTGFKLPRPLAYGVSVTTQEGVVCLGGGDAERHYAEVLLLKWADGKIRVERLPPMPDRAAFFCGATIDRTIYVAGGQDWSVPYRPHGEQPKQPAVMKTFWALDLSKPPGELEWQKLEPWPGRGRMLAVAAVQEGAFFLIGGVAFRQDEEGNNQREYLRDCYRYDPKPGRWTRIANLPRFAAAAPSPAVPLGQSHLGVVGGDDAEYAGRMEELGDDHPGFPAGVLVYHTITDTWITLGRFPKDTAAGIWPPVTTGAAWWRGRYVVPTGEARPGVRTPNVYWAEPVQTTKHFAVLDYAVVAAYLGVLVWMGFYFSKREKSTDDFFLAGRRVPWWAAGMSIFGTQLSAITFMAIPSLVYRTDWVYFLGNMMIVVMAPVVVFVYLPFYRRLNVTTAYEYLERRFNVCTRLLGSAAFVLFQLGRMGIVLYLPALALSAVTGINVYLCILVMGVLATLYTVLGGIEAVIWTDVLQVFVLLGGALLSLLIIVTKVDGGLVGVISLGAAAEKFHAANLTWNVATTALWVVIVGRCFEQLVPYTADQTCVQRYLTTADEKQAARSIWTNAALTIPATLIFFGVGTALWAFYKTHPALLNPTGRTDDIFPWFIAQQLPMGVAGLVIAGLFAAAMSSLDSSMNSMATAITTDFYRKLKPAAADHRCLRLARWLTVLLGVFGTGFALYMAYINSTSMWDQYTKILGLFGGGLAGLFAAGIFTRRITGPSVIVGFIASAAVLYGVKRFTDVHFFLYAGTGIVTCVVVGYLASFVLPGRGRNLDALTVFTLPRRD